MLLKSGGMLAVEGAIAYLQQELAGRDGML